MWRTIINNVKENTYFCTLIFDSDFRMEEDNIDTEPPPSYATVTQEILLKSIIQILKNVFLNFYLSKNDF